MEPSAFPQHTPGKNEQRFDSRTARGAAFRALHLRDGAFIIPNPWDTGTARLLAHLGFEALATTSAGFAASVGRRDYAVSRDEMIAHVAVIAAATPLPVSADLQNGFGDAPEAAAETIRLAAETGVVGGSIEDSTGKQDQPIYEFEYAVERVRAACEAARRNALRATRDSPLPMLMRFTPSAASSARFMARPGMPASTFTGRSTERTTAAMSSLLTSPGAYNTSAPAS